MQSANNYFYFLNYKLQIKMKTETIYTGTYKVYRVFRKSNKREIIRRGLTRDEAMCLVSRYPNSNRSMVVFDRQFFAAKYFQTVSN